MLCLLFFSGNPKEHSKRENEENLWWRNTSSDQELKSLSSSLHKILDSAYADTTNKKYSRGWKNWLDWSSKKSEVISIPASPFYVALYFNRVLQINGTRGALTEAFYGIRWGHLIAGFSSPTDNPFIKVVFEGCQRLAKSNPRGKKDAITADMVKSLFDCYAQPENLPNYRFMVMVLICFSGFMRIDEALNIQLQDVKITDSHLEIHLDKSKTDQMRDGHIIYISRLESKYCPVKFFESYLNLATFDFKENKEAFVIPRVFKLKRGYRASMTSGISYSRAREIFNEKIGQLRNDGKNFGLHSLRAGGASAAAENGVPDRLISKHGRWKSERARNGYIHDTVFNRNRVSQSLGL